MKSLILLMPISNMGSMGSSYPSLEGMQVDGSLLNSSGERTYRVQHHITFLAYQKLYSKEVEGGEDMELRPT
jgi:hypothetical protein